MYAHRALQASNALYICCFTSCLWITCTRRECVHYTSTTTGDASAAQGFVYKPNPAHGVVLQGCVWHWWMAANATGTMARHQHIKWVSAPNGIMPTNTLHRIKMKIACTNHHRTFDEEWQPRRWWSRDLVLEMERRPNATSRGPPWSPAQHTCGSGSAVACRSATTASSRTTHPSPLILCLLCEVPRPPSSLLLSRAGNSGPQNT